MGAGKQRKGNLAEESAPQGEDHYHSIVETALDAFVAMDANGMITEWNRQAEATFGWSRQEAVGRELCQTIIPVRHREAHKKGVAHFLATGEGPVLNKRIEITGLHHSGLEFPVELSIWPVREKTGYAFYAFVRDITERKRAERRLAVQYGVTRALAESSTLDEAVSGILREIGEAARWDVGCAWELDKRMNVLRCVDYWEATSGLAPEFKAQVEETTLAPGTGFPGEVWDSGRPLWRQDVCQNPHFSRAAAAAQAGLRTGLAFPILADQETFRVIEFFSRKDRKPDQHLDQMYTAVGRQFHQFVERKRAEKALSGQAQDLARSNAELERFAFVASHDLQEPLRQVASYTQLLAERYQGKLDADAQDFIGYVVDGTVRMQELIRDLLAYSRVRRQAREFAPTSSRLALERALTTLQATISEARATVEYGDLPVVAADAAQLVELFENLIANAIKYRAQQSPRIEVSAEQKGKEWVFSLRDNGIGIDPQYSKRIFLIFQRLHTKKDYPGTGVGLAICKRIVEAHGGRIWVESQPGEGATFCFSIPNQGDGKAAAAADSLPPGDSRQGRT